MSETRAWSEWSMKHANIVPPAAPSPLQTHTHTHLGWCHFNDVHTFLVVNELNLGPVDTLRLILFLQAVAAGSSGKRAGHGGWARLNGGSKGKAEVPPRGGVGWDGGAGRGVCVESESQSHKKNGFPPLTQLSYSR